MSRGGPHGQCSGHPPISLETFSKGDTDCVVLAFPSFPLLLLIAVLKLPGMLWPRILWETTFWNRVCTHSFLVYGLTYCAVRPRDNVLCAHS